VTSFAANAAGLPGERGAPTVSKLVKPAKKTPNVASKPKAAKGVSKAAPKAAGKRTASLKKAKNKVALVATERKGSGKKLRGAKGKALKIDTMTTAAIAGAKAIKATGEPGDYGTIIARYATSYGVPLSLAHAVIKVESNYRPGVVGSAGEIGLMQIKPATARMLGYSGSANGLHDPDTNIRFGMKYLSMAKSLGDGTTCGTILKYNAGHAAKRMNPVSSAYCAKVTRLMAGL
jgi:soluble lytic murein transglycosylase-like protein